jgi:hypothetical protein
MFCGWPKRQGPSNGSLLADHYEISRKETAIKTITELWSRHASGPVDYWCFTNELRAEDVIEFLQSSNNCLGNFPTNFGAFQQNILNAFPNELARQFCHFW